jgi:hypothetical protein
MNGDKAAANGDDGVRCDIRPTKDQAGYLDQLVKIGLYGKNRTDVARYLVVKGLESLAQQGIVKLQSIPPGDSDG